ncbi:MAG: alkaline phosphatase family protein, partial [Thermodesulfobacteriota bacterium]
MKSFSKKGKKALIIGLDGVPYSLLQHYLKKGLLPNLKKILGEGFSLYQMNASIPDVSSVSWSSFVTGVNPGEHGIYGFTDLLPNSYSLCFPNAEDRMAPPFWEILGRTNRKISTLSQKYEKKIGRPLRSIIFNVPHTYPAYPIHGILVSGFVAIDLRKATTPESAYAYLNSINYVIDVEAERAREDKKGFMNHLFGCFEIRKKAIHHFFENENWDLFFACVTETDRLHHFFFDASMDENHPYHQDFQNFYVLLDQWIKSLYEAFQKRYSEKGFFMILSDHGFSTVKREVYINRFLEEEGLLVLKEEGDFYERIDGQTKAFNLDPCRIYIHDQSYPRGSVRWEEKPDLLMEIKKRLTK